MAGVIEECDPEEKLPTPSEFVMKATLDAPYTNRSYLCDRHWDWYKIYTAGSLTETSTERVTGADGVTRRVEVVSERNVTDSLVFAGALPRAAPRLPERAHPRPATARTARARLPPTARSARSRPGVELEVRAVPHDRPARRRRRGLAPQQLGQPARLQARGVEGGAA